MIRSTQSAACGTWPSPISAEWVATTRVRLMQPQICENWVYWVESHPTESGRCILVRGWPGEPKSEVTGPPFSVRSRAQEYGGGDFVVTPKNLYFINDADQQIYVQPNPTGASRRLTDAPACRFADLRVDDARARLVCVRRSWQE